MSKAALLELADRVEKASGADRELDARIACCLDNRTVHEVVDGKILGRYSHPPHDICVVGWAPHYTSSLDAAMTLVPEGFAASVEWSPAFPGHAWLFPPDNINDVSFEGAAATPALALIAASLRARAQQESTDA